MKRKGEIHLGFPTYYAAHEFREILRSLAKDSGWLSYEQLWNAYGHTKNRLWNEVEIYRPTYKRGWKRKEIVSCFHMHIGQGMPVQLTIPAPHYVGIVYKLIYKLKRRVKHVQ